MKSVAPCCRLDSLSAAVSREDKRKGWLAPRKVWTAGRGRSVGSSSMASGGASFPFQ